MENESIALPLGKQVLLHGHFEAPVTLEHARALGNGYECRVRLPDGSLEEAIISREEALVLAASPEEQKATNRPVDAEKLRLLYWLRKCPIQTRSRTRHNTEARTRAIRFAATFRVNFNSFCKCCTPKSDAGKNSYGNPSAVPHNFTSFISSTEAASKTKSQSPSARGRKSRMEGYQGLSVRSSSHNQCATCPNSIHTGFPIAPARCASWP